MRIKGLFIFLFLLSLRPLFREYKSEYKQKFRPFSQYEYCGDGKFYNTSTSPPSESAVDGGHRSRQETSLHLSGEPWYQEVIELRKIAKDYKCRGWGTGNHTNHLNIFKIFLSKRPGAPSPLQHLQPTCGRGLQQRIPVSPCSRHHTEVRPAAPTDQTFVLQGAT